MALAYFVSFSQPHPFLINHPPPVVYSIILYVSTVISMSKCVLGFFFPIFIFVPFQSVPKCWPDAKVPKRPGKLDIYS